MALASGCQTAVGETMSRYAPRAPCDSLRSTTNPGHVTSKEARGGPGVSQSHCARRRANVNHTDPLGPPFDRARTNSDPNLLISASGEPDGSKPGCESADPRRAFRPSSDDSLTASRSSASSARVGRVRERKGACLPLGSPRRRVRSSRVEVVRARDGPCANSPVAAPISHCRICSMRRALSLAPSSP